MMCQKEKINILGTKFPNITRSEAATFIVDSLQGQEKASVFTPNPEIVMEAYKNPQLKKILNQSELIVPDGIGVVIGSRIIRRPLKERVAGYDLLQEVFGRIADKEITVFFFGAAKGVTDKAKAAMEAKYPGLNVVGTYHGYYKTDEEVIEAMNAVNPDFVIVGLGAPKQELWITKNRDRINGKVFYGCGGSFDVMAGVVNRAPDIFIKLNLEWFHRLITQPTRAKRMLQLPVFLVKMVLEGRKYR